MLLDFVTDCAQREESAAHAELYNIITHFLGLADQEIGAVESRVGGCVLRGWGERAGEREGGRRMLDAREDAAPNYYVLRTKPTCQAFCNVLPASSSLHPHLPAR